MVRFEPSGAGCAAWAGGRGDELCLTGKDGSAGCVGVRSGDAPVAVMSGHCEWEM